MVKTRLGECLFEEIENLQKINEEHRKLNGELREENKQLKENRDKAIEYIKHSWWLRFDQLYDNSHDLKDWEVKELMGILEGEEQCQKK